MAIAILAKKSKLMFFIAIFCLVMIMYSFMGGTFSTIEGNTYTIDFTENRGEWRGAPGTFNRIANRLKADEIKAKRQANIQARREARREANGQTGSNTSQRV
jgi:hypothetical protein